jgi:hypothetical protein
MLRICRVAEQPSSSQDGVNSIELVSWLECLINREALIFVDQFMVLCFMVTGALLAVRSI